MVCCDQCGRPQVVSLDKLSYPRFLMGRRREPTKAFGSQNSLLIIIQLAEIVQLSGPLHSTNEGLPVTAMVMASPPSVARRCSHHIRDVVAVGLRRRGSFRTVSPVHRYSNLARSRNPVTRPS